jgi:ABC-2 type transport system ATP-binding protein
VLKDLSFSLASGEILGLLGPNGAGKSTLMALLCGLLQPLSGTVRVLGGDPALPSTRAHLGLAPQELALYEELSAQENLLVFGRLQGLKGADLKERVAVLLAETGLAARARDRVSTYSGGMKRRLNLAAALLHRPALLLLDEATVGVDPQSRLALFDLVENCRAVGQGLLYATHHMEEAQRLCDRVAIVDQGCLLALGTVPELLQRHGGALRLRVERKGMVEEVETRDAVAELARQQALGPFESFSLHPPDLEQVFMHLTGRSLRD